MTRFIYKTFLFFLVVSFSFLAFIIFRKKTYDWSYSECAAYNYPMKILRNNISWGSGSTGTLRVTAGSKGWGHVGGGYVVGDRYKPVPDSLFVEWYSIPEHKFYTGRFKIDSNKLKRDLEKLSFAFIYPCFAPHGKITLFISGRIKGIKFFSC